ncbi:late transcription unit protein LtuB [Candidatus Woesearchaeota archaeon]|nr:late transcription unit protein LtuB [Candidatus Woesearchaeota archaeon]
MQKVLREFNLTDNEIKIYLTLLELGSALAGEITTKTGIHRRNVYDSIERLIKKGLVGYINKNNRKYFKSANPKHFFSLLEQEKESLKQREKAFKSILPQLLLSKKLAKNKQRVTIFEGKKGLITILEDIIKTGQTNLVFSTTEIHMVKDYLKIFHKKRIRAKVTDKLLLDKKDIKRAKQLAKLSYTEVKLMPRVFDSPMAVNIYSNKVGMLILSEDPIGILIEDEQVANSYRKYFTLMWEMAKEV